MNSKILRISFVVIMTLIVSSNVNAKGRLGGGASSPVPTTCKPEMTDLANSIDDEIYRYCNQMQSNEKANCLENRTEFNRIFVAEINKL